MKQVYYFGCLGGGNGHALYDTNETSFSYHLDRIPDWLVCWNLGLLDTGLLKNGKHKDVYDGKVFWTCGGKTVFWFAFFWWDRSGDTRSNSNSGFYVRGFPFEQRDEAFSFACQEWTKVVARQKHPLQLQD